MKKYYQEPNKPICAVCGKRITSNGCFVQYKQATCEVGMYWKWVGHICEECHKNVVAPLLRNFQQVWDTHEFEKCEMGKHLLTQPENSVDENKV